MQKTKHWLITIAMLLCSITASAYDFEVDGIYYSITDATNLTVEVTSNGKGNTYSGALTLPLTVTYENKTYRVTSIGSLAFTGSENLTSVTIPGSVLKIGDNAFNYCRSLSDLYIEDGKECLSLGIGEYQAGGLSDYYGMFRYCPLQYVYIGRNLSYDTKKYYQSPFYGCQNLTNVTIGSNVTAINDYAFNGCIALKHLVIMDSDVDLVLGVNEKYHYHPSGSSPSKPLFYDCPLETLYLGRNLSNSIANKKLQKVEIGGSVTEITGIFSGCTNLMDVSIPNSVTTIGSYAFCDCKNLTNISIPNSVTTIGSYAFKGCKKLTNISIPNSVTTIGNYAFQDCTNLTEISMSNSVTTIGSYAFQNCINLTDINIPNSVTTIKGNAFSGCDSLSTVYLEDGELKLFLGSNGLDYKYTGEGLFYNCKQLRYIYIGRELDFETSKSYGYSPFYQKDVDTLIISKKQSKNLGFNTIHKQATLLYIDSDYSKVIPNNIQESCTLHYFNMPYPTSNYKDIKTYLTNGLGCKAKMVPLGDIQTGFESLTVTLNDTLIVPFNVSPSTNPNVVRYKAVRINESYITPDSANVYKCQNLKIGTNYPVELRFGYDGKQYTVSGNVTTKKFNPTFSASTTLTTATIRYNVGDTIGLGKMISEVGVYYNNTHYPAEGKDEWHDLPYHTTIKNLYPGNSFNCQIYCKIDTNFYYSDWQYFNVKSPVINLVESKKCTQTTANLTVTGKYSDENISPIEIGVMSGYKSTWGGYKCDGKYIADENGNVLITGLKPDTTYVMTPYIKYNEDEFYPITGTNRNITTAGIAIACNSVAASATTITVEGMHDAGDATVIEYGFSDYEANTNKTTLTGLEPNSTYTMTYYVTTAEGGTLYQSVTAQTENLTFNTLKAKATSNTRAVICAEANIANEESGTGFEWRRIDAPDLVPSEVVGCAVHDSIMEGVLSNLSANTYYKYRPFYTSASGQSYYGEWMGFGTADAYVYFTPTVHTYATATASANAIRLTGYVLPGSDDIVEQGFEYWAESSATRSSNVTKVTASGQRMSVLLENLEPGTRYKYRAFATTTKETIYGEIQMFETPTMTDVEEMTYHSEPIISSRRGVIYIDNVDENCIVRVFTLSGAKIYEGRDREFSVEGGIYIIHVGAITHKLVVK